MTPPMNGKSTEGMPEVERILPRACFIYLTPDDILKIRSGAPLGPSMTLLGILFTACLERLQNLTDDQRSSYHAVLAAGHLVREAPRSLVA